MRGAYSFGSDLRWCELNGIRVSETVMPAGLTLAPHAHAPGQICFILEGEYDERTTAGSHTLRPGMIQVHQPGEHHSNETLEDEALTLLVSIDGYRWLEMRAAGPRTTNALLSELASEVRAELRSGSRESRAALEGLALLILAGTARDSFATAVEPAWFRDAVSFIEHRYHERLSLGSVANAVGVHRATLAASFRRFRGTSVGEYLRDVRLRHAARALTHTSAPLAEIAVANGFSDQAHFGRMFKKITGSSPGRFRRRSRRSE